ncbi:uncharacterized protein LOC127707939 [Mytilus californianus]|uniref:uncharacterized protein LOC127707939 n=1 Tax=Mytilus californianus TaxID=6549 RepID=UPI0022453534|nr:uncharacterized protein LOC127707939 [Mytilus californianus]
MAYKFTSSSEEDKEFPVVSHSLSLNQLTPKAAKNCQGLHERVSDWNLHQVEKQLHIYYATDYLDSHKDVFNKINTSTLLEFTKDQKKYVQDLQRFLEFDSDYEELWLKTSMVKKKLSVLRNKLEPISFLSQPVYISKGEIFINTFDSFFDQCMEAKQTRFQVSEGMFASLIISLGQACCLTTSLCLHKQTRTSWNNLKGVTVKSQPECRFFNSRTFGNCTTLKPKAIVSVVEVKNGKRIGYTGLKHPERGSYSKKSKHSKRHHHIRKRHISSTEDIYTEESHQVTEFTSSNISSQISDMSDNRIPEIISYISSNTLATHAGELLLDLHKYKSEPKVSNIMTLPGIIVDGTKVYFTMLEMSESHHEKLDKNIELNGSDRATVYYAKPLDILVQSDRDIIIENLVRLHNI